MVYTDREPCTDVRVGRSIISGAEKGSIRHICWHQRWEFQLGFNPGGCRCLSSSEEGAFVEVRKKGDSGSSVMKRSPGKKNLEDYGILKSELVQVVEKGLVPR